MTEVTSPDMISTSQGPSSGDCGPTTGTMTHRRTSEERQIGTDRGEPFLGSSTEDRVEKLRDQLRLEAAIVEGTKRIVLSLERSKPVRKFLLKEVRICSKFSTTLFDLKSKHIEFYSLWFRCAQRPKKQRISKMF